MKEAKKKSGLVWGILCGIFATLGYILLFAALWFAANFGTDVGFDSVIFTLLTGMNGVNTNMVWLFLLQVVLPGLLCGGATFGVLMYLPKLIFRNKLSSGKRPLAHRITAAGLALILTVSLTAVAVNKAGLDDYIRARLDSTTLFEDYYVDPNEVEITFPEEKRNIIYIFLESMETTYMTKEDSGSSPEDYIPELTTLAKNHINFSDNAGVGGGRTTTGSTWTIGAMISHTSGLPLCLPQRVWNNGLNYYSKVVPGITSLSDILHENGYNQALMVGSDASFGGRREYYTQHGCDRIYDLYTAREEGIIPSDYWNNFWGFEDLYLFQYAKMKLTEMAESESPFAFTMLTVDTHHPDGYNCLLCESNYDNHFTEEDAYHKQFANVMSCSSRQVAEFVEWIQEQDFYENTTVIITGDHLSMNHAYHNSHTEDGHVRRIYNSILNSATEEANTKNRNFTTLDMFPTTLAAMGCTIEGNRLGLGTNLFSGKQTLAEELGYDYLCNEIAKVSDFYQNKFLYGDRNE